MSHTEIHEAGDGSITVSERPDEQERHEQSLERLVSEIRDDPDATATEKRLASALIALQESN
jgi:hypothetical protein